MECKKCGQQMIDKTDYCVKCGAKLRDSKGGITLRGLLLIFGAIIVVTLIVCYMIMHFNTRKDIEPYLDKDKTTTEQTSTN